MKHIAVVEDEALMREELADMLRRAGYAITEVTDFADVTGQLLALAPDLVLLDLNLPEVSGFQICRDIKQRSALPVLVLTSRDQLRDEVHALELGADEYLTKPYRKERLLARIGNVLKRYEGRPNLLEGADFLLDRQTYTLFIHNQSVVLPPNQGKLLEALLAHGGQTVAKDDLSRALWGTTEFIDENALQVNLTRLKKTMASLGMRQQLVSVRGVGYRLEVPQVASRKPAAAVPAGAGAAGGGSRARCAAALAGGRAGLRRHDGRDRAGDGVSVRRRVRGALRTLETAGAGLHGLSDHAGRGTRTGAVPPALPC